MDQRPSVICLALVSKFISSHICGAVWEASRACYLWTVTEKLEEEVEIKPPPHRQVRWYFGGTAACLAAVITHPLDLIKVNMQLARSKRSIYRFCKHVWLTQGIRGFYYGFSAAMLRQATHSLTRFGIFELCTDYINPQNMLQRYLIASASGAMGGLLSTPVDIVSIRMQSDVKLKPELRRNYKSVFDGLKQIYQEAGLRGLTRGATSASTKGDLLTVGQVAFYDHLKSNVVSFFNFRDQIETHLLIALVVALTASAILQPVDYVKTQLMNARAGETTGLMEVLITTWQKGPRAFFTGYVAAVMRLAPQIMITLFIIEQMRIRYGYIPEEPLKTIIVKPAWE